MQNQYFDVAIIGGGIVGLSTAWQLIQQHPKKNILLIEKESDVGMHQTGHNSGVIHAGVYYAPGSLKAQFCKEGALATKIFCEKYDIPFDQCGKLLVATDAKELERMDALYERCQENAIHTERLSKVQLQEREPNIRGEGALFVKETGIVNYQLICKRLMSLFVAAGGEVRLGEKVVTLNEKVDCIDVKTSKNTYQCGYLVSCSGLMADRMTKMLNIPVDFQIIPFRGEYFRLAAKHNDIVNHLIYPIPDPELPFLGVHLTRMIDGTVTVGPNAVQGWKREGYGRVNFDLLETIQMFTFIGYWKLLKKFWKTGLKETRNSWWKSGYLKEVNKYCQQIDLEDLEPYPAGVRAQAVTKNGDLVHDFLFANSRRSLHVCNAPSPAATSAFPIGKHIIQKLDDLITKI